MSQPFETWWNEGGWKKVQEQQRSQSPRATLAGEQVRGTQTEAGPSEQAQRAAGVRYSFIRREMPNFEKLKKSGYTALFAADDPRLDAQIAAARKAGVEYGLWADPNWYDDKSPEAFARNMATLNQKYGPQVIVPDIEFIGKGYKGSEGWNYNAALAQAWQKHLPKAKTALTVMGNQRDFNYEAWKNIAQAWLPQAYGANPKTEVYDPNMIRQVLIDRGVNPALIQPILGVGHGTYWNTYGGPASMWTYDDFMLSDELPWR